MDYSQYNNRYKYISENEKIYSHIIIMDKNRNARQIKIDLYIHHLCKLSNNLTKIKANIKPKHSKLIIHIYKHFTYIINNVLVVLFRNYSYNPTEYFFSLPQHTHIIGLSDEIVIQTIIDTTSIVIESLKQLYFLYPDGLF